MSGARSGARCETILVVEDDAAIRETLRDALDLEGYKVEVAEHGGVALEKLKVLPRPCLILLDLMMPVMNGLEFLEACRKDDTLVTIPVIMVTAFDTLAREAVGTAGIVKKPIDLDRLLEFVHEYCE